MNSLMKPVASGIERPLGAMEKFFYLLNQDHPNHFAITGEVTGPTRIDQWRNGLDLVGHHSPLVWSRIERDSGGVPVFRPSPHGSIPLKVVSYDGSGWTDEVAAQLAQPFDETNPPLLRATLLHSAERSIVVLVAHHSISDGVSLTFLLGDLLRAVSGQDLLRSRESESVERLVEFRYRRALTHATEQATEQATAVARQPKVFRYQDGSTPHVEMLRLSSDTTRKLRERARTERTSVQSALVAALVGASYRLAPEARGEPMRIVSPVDLRRRLLDNSDHLGMCASAVVLADDGPANADLWSRARHLGQGFAGLESPSTLAEEVLAKYDALASVEETAEAKTIFVNVFAGDAAVTNLGVVTLPKVFGSLVLDAIWGPSIAVGLVGEQVIGAATFNDRLHLAHTSYAPIKGLLDQMTAELLDALSNVY
ncbi:phthiocerol/phthiodiolone dimycocerosyl transferase family protein [Paraburkholderia sp. RL17-373-BIF-A]